ncbi:hypothetical protein, partial [Paracoccus sp. (in: a-proteobacteria)]|uniref:hypothetical protein n=1 Tax=Paracoccus sp. TaxID=267 RepID=UPI003A835A25
MKIGFNFANNKSVALTVDQDSQSSQQKIDRWGVAHDAVAVRAGRMNSLTINVPGAVAQQDGSYALDLL